MICNPPLHRYTMFGYPGVRQITCACGRTRSKFQINKTDGLPFSVEMDIQKAVEDHNVPMTNAVDQQ